MDDFDTDRFFKNWLRSTFLQALSGFAIGSLNIALGLLQRHLGISLFINLGFGIGLYIMAYYLLRVKPRDIHRRWAEMRKLDNQFREAMSQLDSSLGSLKETK